MRSDAMRGAPLVTAALLARWPLPELDPTDGKVARGTVMVLGGSDRNAGAVLLAGLAALRAGAGRLQIATAKRAVPALMVAVPEARVTGLATGRDGELTERSAQAVLKDLHHCDTLIVGPGMTNPAACAALMRAAVRAGSSATWVLDGAAMQVLRIGMPRGHELSRTIITPHAGEMAKLRGVERSTVTRSPLAVARRCAKELGVVVALKGPETFIAAPTGEAFTHRGGNAGLGTSGSGDVLAGVIGGLCARGGTPLQAAVMGVLAHGRAGEALARKIAPLGYLASELLGEIPRALPRQRTAPR